MTYRAFNIVAINDNLCEEKRNERKNFKHLSFLFGVVKSIIPDNRSIYV